MWRPFELVIASICCAIAFPVIGFKEQRNHSWLPRPPNQAKLDAEPGTWFHRKKDLLVDSVDTDPEWWGKGFCFLLAIVSFVAVICVISLVVLMWRNA